ncbi:hypothetical protein ABIC83_003071 [Roseateles asaccharophilus]|uniref:hypothetical protein n=1 Tax=Roseateles asaccharophilus TaxID=582607 RepID=UPI003836E9DB
MQALLANDLDLNAIEPRLGAKYSPNLHAYLALERNRNHCRFARVYRDPDGVLWIGFPDDYFFVGARLSSVLVNGSKTQVFAHMRLVHTLVEVEGFWATYVRDGRCAIDVDHTRGFIGDDTRWAVTDERRTCNWCGNATQTMTRWTEAVEKTAWVAEPLPLAA